VNCGALASAVSGAILPQAARRSGRLPAVTAWFRTPCDAACAAFNLCHDGMLFGMAKILVISHQAKFYAFFLNFLKKYIRL